ncbi:MAG TPA: SMC-Scp complex subunit ScpB [Thermomicrobiales bacterium]|nr:SMC-Scp complex subunit ScpB [Thermomicrobiales bacterium]
MNQPSLEMSVESPEEAAAAIEALLFASGSAEEAPTLAAALGWSLTDVKRGLDALDQQLRDGRRGVLLQRLGETVQLVTAPRFGQPIARLLGMERTLKLSSAALETLALVAYRQPVTRSEIEAVRGVDSSGVLATLVARELVEPRGRRSTPGNPVEYGTTAGFLQFFGLTSLDELPPLSD